jgi:uridine phosphorylase
MTSPILNHKHYGEPSVFTAENLLREARRQKALAPGNVPQVCVLDPDGDIGRLLLDTGRARVSPDWACYHTDLLAFEHAGLEMGLVRCAVGAPFAVLVAEELFAAGCRLLLSVTSAGQIADEFGTPPYFVLIEQAWRDEGTSHHYLPAAERASLGPEALRWLCGAFQGSSVAIHAGTTWTTDAPFRETAPAIEFYRRQGVAAVEMEAAALYAFAEARARTVVCFAHVTNQMAVIEGDFEKGRDHGSHDALEVIRLTAQAWLAAKQAQPSATTFEP